MSTRPCACGCGKESMPNGAFAKNHSHGLSPLERFHASYDIDAESGCWVWLRSCGSDGYSRFAFGGTMRSGHRAAYELLVGPIPDGLQIDHLCRNRRCVNPDHLEPVTPRENTRRSLPFHGVLRHWTSGSCPKGHDITLPENVYYRPDDGTRSCAVCRYEANVRVRRRQQGEAIA